TEIINQTSRERDVVIPEGLTRLQSDYSYQMSKIRHATPAIPLTFAAQPGTSTLTSHHSLQSQTHISPNLPAPVMTQPIPTPSLVGGNLPNSTTPGSTGHSSPHPVSPSTPSIKSIWAARIAECLSFANGIGMASLILALAFGVGAWVGMNMQYKQGEK
ncbi:7806_t:CDS:1, partial [Acaulospora colombiana]